MEANGLERMADNKGTVWLIGSETLSSNPPSVLLVSLMIGRGIIISQLFNQWLSGVKTSNVHCEDFLIAVNSKRMDVSTEMIPSFIHMWVSHSLSPTAPSSVSPPPHEEQIDYLW